MFTEARVAERNISDLTTVVSSGSSSRGTVCFPFAGGLVGGSHVSAIELIRALPGLGYTPVVVLHSAEGALADYLKQQGISFRLLPTSFIGNSAGLPARSGAGAIGRKLRDQLKLARFLRNAAVQIVHTNEGAMHATWALPTKIVGARLLYHHRGAPDARGLRYLAPVFASRIVGVSHHALSRVPARLHERCAVVRSPFDVDLQVNRAAARKALLLELGVNEATRLIGFFGNMIPRKRPLQFIDAMVELARDYRHRPVLGLMFGAPADPFLNAEVERRLTAPDAAVLIRRMGFRSPSAPLLAACDIHVVPAVNEPFGRTLIEAMLLGVPVIASASGGNIEAIEDGVTGVLVPPDEPDAMARACAALLAEPDRSRAIAENAREWASRNFGLQGHAHEIAGCYGEMLKGG